MSSGLEGPTFQAFDAVKRLIDLTAATGESHGLAELGALLEQRAQHFSEAQRRGLVLAIDGAGEAAEALNAVRKEKKKRKKRAPVGRFPRRRPREGPTLLFRKRLPACMQARERMMVGTELADEGRRRRSAPLYARATTM